MSCLKVLLRHCTSLKTVNNMLVDDAADKQPLCGDKSDIKDCVDYRLELTEDYLNDLPQDERNPGIDRIPHFPVWLVLAIFHDTTYRQQHAYIKMLYNLGCREEPWRWQEPLAQRKYRHVAQALSALDNWQQDEILHSPWYKLFWLDCSKASTAFYTEISRVSRVTQGFTACRNGDVLNHVKYRAHQFKRSLMGSAASCGC